MAGLRGGAAILGLLAVAGLSAIAVFLTGEPAEEVVEGRAGVSHDAIEAHEEWAGTRSLRALRREGLPSGRCFSDGGANGSGVAPLS